MSTLSIRTSHIPGVWLLAPLVQLGSSIVTVFDVFAEAQEMARAAHKRYPFIEG